MQKISLGGGVFFNCNSNTNYTLLPIESLVVIPLNESLRVGRGSPSFYSSIKQDGLDEPLKVFKNSKYILSGNGRYEVLMDYGATHVPVIYIERTEEMNKSFDEQNEIDLWHPDVKDALTTANMRDPVKTIGYYTLLRKWMLNKEGYSFEQPAIDFLGNKKSIETYIKQSKIAISYADFEAIEGLRFGCKIRFEGKTHHVSPRVELYDDLSNTDKNREEFTPKKARKAQLDDYKEQSGVNYPKNAEMANLFTSMDINKVLLEVQEKFLDVQNSSNGNRYDINWFNSLEPAAVSNIVHSMVVSFTTAELKNTLKKLNSNYTAEASINQSTYDIHIKNAKGNLINTLEIKTTCDSSKNGWTTKTKKGGYALFIEYNRENTHYFAALAYLENLDWKKAGPYNSNIKAEKLNERALKVYQGEIHLNNSKWVVAPKKLEQTKIALAA
jgi:hypothetical protein